MTKEKAKKKFKKLYRYTMRLKEGGKAWERNMVKLVALKKIIIG